MTEGDLLSHREMYYSLLNTWPGLHIVSEEKDNKNSRSIAGIQTLQSDAVQEHLTDRFDTRVDKRDILVWIDPLDATKEFSENLLHYVTTMVCVAVKGEPVIGVIHKPFEGETFWAWHGHGHYLPHGPKATKQGAPVVIVSRSHAGDVNKTAKAAFGDRIKVIPAGGAGFKVIELVMGRVDAYLHKTRIKKWDICAGNAILNALNGKMSSLKGDAIDYSNSEDVVLNDGLLATMKEHDKYLKALGGSKT